MQESHPWALKVPLEAVSALRRNGVSKRDVTVLARMYWYIKLNPVTIQYLTQYCVLQEANRGVGSSTTIDVSRSLNSPLTHELPAIYHSVICSVVLF